MENQGTVIQLSLWESIAGLLCLSPVSIAGLAVTCIILYMILRRKSGGAYLRTMIFSVLLYYYLCIVFCNIVGTPSLSQLLRTASYGESLFSPNLNLVPFVEGISMGYILNVICFMPLGFLAPLISRIYEKAGKCFLIGLGVSLGDHDRNCVPGDIYQLAWRKAVPVICSEAMQCHRHSAPLHF